jgi:hypothetical protein
MNGQELRNIIDSVKSAKHFFEGIFSINTLPTNLNTPSFIICNFDTNENPGTHWFCLFKTTKSNLECFDSLGLNEGKQDLLKKYCKIGNIKSLIYNETAVQSNSTTTCGKFVLYFAFHRLHNLDLDFTHLLNDIFTENIPSNENKVASFLNEIINNE